MLAIYCPIDFHDKLLAVFKDYRHAFEFRIGSAIGVDHCIRTGEHAPVVSIVRLKRVATDNKWSEAIKSNAENENGRRL